MYYSEVFFKKDIYDVTEQDLVDFFADSPEESSILELKSGDNLKIEKIFPEVCALHNTQGGLVIIGSPIPRKHEGREYFDGETTRSPFKDKDWLYQKISSNISPIPSGLRIHDVKMTDGKFIQIIDIPKSLHPPHQCLNNGIYYLRFETQSRFATHGLVEAMFNRRQEPTIKFDLSEFRFVNNVPTEYEFMISNESDFPLIGISGVVNFYDVKSCWVTDKLKTPYNKLYNNIDNRYNMSYFIDEFNRNGTTNVKGMVSYHRYNITSENKPFLILMLIWATNMNLRKKGFLIMPNIDKAVSFNIEDDFFDSAKSAVEKMHEVTQDVESKKGLLELLEKLN